MTREIILSEHFKLTEFTHSATAQAKGIDNSLDVTVSDHAKMIVNNLHQLCVHVLEPLRRHFNIPVTISSGYRNPILNAIIGGVKNSQHIVGEAADIRPPRRSSQGKPFTELERRTIFSMWFSWLMKQDFDQLILEKNMKSGIAWIHVSYRQDGKNRRQVITSKESLSYSFFSPRKHPTGEPSPRDHSR